jgi:hypothetical protein
MHKRFLLLPGSCRPLPSNFPCQKRPVLLLMPLMLLLLLMRLLPLLLFPLFPAGHCLHIRPARKDRYCCRRHASEL